MRRQQLHRTRLWKVELQTLANETGLRSPSATSRRGPSKWNEIEHRLFSASYDQLAGQAAESHEVIINLIGGTTTRTA